MHVPNFPEYFYLLFIIRHCKHFQKSIFFVPKLINSYTKINYKIFNLSIV